MTHIQAAWELHRLGYTVIPDGGYTTPVMYFEVQLDRMKLTLTKEGLVFYYKFIQRRDKNIKGAKNAI